MRDLREDCEEVRPELESWVRRQRRQKGIKPDEPTCWFVEIFGGEDSNVEWLGSSPGDALSIAECLANNARSRQGHGAWILETFGDGVNAPRRLRVHPCLDEGYPT